MIKSGEDEKIKIKKVTRGDKNLNRLAAELFVQWVNRRKGYTYLRLK